MQMLVITPKKMVVRLLTKMKFSTKDFFSKCDQICRKPGIWSHLLKQALTENFNLLGSVRSFFLFKDSFFSPLSITCTN